MAISGSTSGQRSLDVVLFSLEPWDSIWRRNQFLVRELLRRRPEARVLFVEPAVDAPYELRNGRRPPRWGLRRVQGWEHLWALRPLKLLPRRLGSIAARSLNLQVQRSLTSLHFDRPVFWVNDDAYADFATKVRWPILYDVTDDWTLATQDEVTRARRLRDDSLLVERANLVVVCSSALAASRGTDRKVIEVPNAVDIDHFRRFQDRPVDLPPGPYSLYVGTLQEDRLDLGLCEELALSVPATPVVLLGPDALQETSRSRLRRHPNVSMLGPRSYEAVPGYFQHAHVVVVPHLVTPFTDSLDPIKAYECLAVGRPTVATPVAGFRHLGTPIEVADRHSFVDVVAKILKFPERTSAKVEVPTWAERGEVFVDLLERLSQGTGAPESAH